jgi:hypothetical protein
MCARSTWTVSAIIEVPAASAKAMAKRAMSFRMVVSCVRYCAGRLFGVVEYPIRPDVGINSLRVVSNNVTMGALAEIEREAVHTAATLFLAVGIDGLAYPHTALACCVGPQKRGASRALDRVRPQGRLYTARLW